MRDLDQYEKRNILKGSWRNSTTCEARGKPYTRIIKLVTTDEAVSVFISRDINRSSNVWCVYLHSLSKELVDKLKSLGAGTFDVTHFSEVTTNEVKTYVAGCYIELPRDDSVNRLISRTAAVTDNFSLLPQEVREVASFLITFIKTNSSEEQ